MKVLITGGAGFIGSHLADKLLNVGAQVMVVDNFTTGTALNNKETNSLRCLELSIEDSIAFESAFAQFMPDIVVHAAASYKNPDDWATDVETNILGTINTVLLSRKYGVKKLVYLQTSLCYGLHPTENPVTINHPISGEGSSYAISKTAAERYIELSGLSFLSFRLANVYGPRNLTGPVPRFYSRIKSGQTCTIVNSRRDFIYVDDVVNLIFIGLNTNKEGHYHICTGKDISIEEIYMQIKHAMKIENSLVEYQEVKSDDAKQILLDPTQTLVDFDWTHKVDISQGIASTIDWYNQNPIGKTFTHLKAFT